VILGFFSYVPPEYLETAILLGWLPAASLEGHSLGQNGRILMERPCACDPAPMPWAKQKKWPVQIAPGSVIPDLK
jgi:hypothetical protein